MTDDNQDQILKVFAQQTLQEDVKVFTFLGMIEKLVKNGKGLRAIELDDLIMNKRIYIKYGLDYTQDGGLQREKSLHYNNNEMVNITSSLEDKKYVIYNERTGFFLGVY